MNVLAAFLLAVALVFRAAPLCAAPIVADAATAMADCDHSTTGHEKAPDKKGQDAARACHACAFSPAVPAPIEVPLAIATDDPPSPTLTQLSGGVLKPPVPPPRFATAPSFQHYHGV